MRILIAQSYFRVLDPKELERQMPYPPLGALIAATMARRAGHDVQFFDGMMASSPGELTEVLRRDRVDVLFLYDDEFNYLTKMCLSNMRVAALRVLSEARLAHVRAFVYSSDAADHSTTYLKAGADAVLVGEGENTLLDIIASLAAGQFDSQKDTIHGIRFLESGTMRETARRDMQTDLDVFPDPDFGFVDISRYATLWRKAHGYFSLNVSTTRGCPFHCNWCAKPIYGQAYHVRSPKKVVDHMADLRERYDVNHIWMTDDIFGLKPGWLSAFADELAARRLRIPFKCLTRADLLLRGQTIDELARSGCSSIWIGAESGSQKILDAMEKGTTVAQIYEASQRARERNIDVAFFIQFGYTGERWSDIRLTRQMIRDLQPSDIGISVSYPLPGTKFYESVRSQLKDKTNWTDSDDLDLMYDGMYPKAFYRMLHRMVHAEFRIREIVRHRRFHRLAALLYHSARFITFWLRVRRFLQQSPVHP